MIDQENVTRFAQDNDVPFTTYTSLCHTREVEDLIGGEIEEVNVKFARVETIKQFRLIDQLLDPEDDELTPTQKLKRKVVNEKYCDLIDSMYQSGVTPGRRASGSIRWRFLSPPPVSPLPAIRAGPACPRCRLRREPPGPVSVPAGAVPGARSCREA